MAVRFPFRRGMIRSFTIPKRALPDQLAAVSVGVVDGEVRLDLDYFDDSRAEVDLNLAYTAGGKFVEVQGSAENGGGFDRERMNAMFDVATRGCEATDDDSEESVGMRVAGC